MSDHEVVKNVIISSDSFIWSAPTATYKIKLPIFDQHSDFVLHFCGLPFPPHLEILNLCECKSPIRIPEQLLYGRVKDISDASNVDAPLVLSSVEVFDSAQPALISMRVWNEMHNSFVYVEFLLGGISEIFQLCLGFLEIL